MIAAVASTLLLIGPASALRMHDSSACIYMDNFYGSLWSNGYSVESDTILDARLLEADYISGWDHTRLGVDVRFRLDTGRSHWSVSLLIDSALVLLNEMEPQPGIVEIEECPMHMSVSPSGRYVLIHHQVRFGDRSRYLSLIDINQDRIDQVTVTNPVNLTRARGQRGPIVTDRGHVLARRRSGTGSPGKVLIDVSNPDVYLAPDICWGQVHSEIGDRFVSVVSQESGRTKTIQVLDTSSETLASFDSGRLYPLARISHSGELVLYSNEMGLIIYSITENDMADIVLYGKGLQRPVLSPSDEYWACSFDSEPQGDTEEDVIMLGKTFETGCERTIFRNTSRLYANPRVVTVSDDGRVLCLIEIADEGFARSYRYILLEPTGEVIWISSLICPSFWSIRPVRNFAHRLVDINPRLIDLSADGERMIEYSDGIVRLIEIG